MAPNRTLAAAVAAFLSFIAAAPSPTNRRPGRP
jgi:hypothetical protein